MASSSSSDDELITSINITPLVDVVLVLLIILMVTATAIVSQTVPLDLPKAATGEPTSTVLAISITSSGELFLDGDAIERDALRAKVREARSGEDDVRALVAADGATPHRNIVSVLDLLRSEQVTQFAINVAPEDLDE